jgi:hypothetical protein
MDWSNADMANGFAALLNGYRQGSSEARAAATQGQELDLKRKEQEQNARYMDAMAQKALRENNMTPEGGRFVANTIGMPTVPKQPMSISEAGTLINAYNNKKSIAQMLADSKAQKDAQKQQEKAEKDTHKYFVERDKYIMGNITKLKGQLLSSMNDPEMAVKINGQIEAWEKEREENKLNALQRGIDVFQTPLPAGIPSTVEPPAIDVSDIPTYATPAAQPAQAQPNFMNKAMDFFK